MRIIRNIVGMLLFTLGVQVHAGIKWVDVGVDGLTCSMCSRSVELSIRRLYFVEDVNMSLEKTEGRIYMKPNQPLDLKQIARAVKDAGFSVRFVRIEFDFSDLTVNEDGTFLFQGQPYIWMDFKNGSAKGNVALQLVDEGFLPRKESSAWKKRMAQDNPSQKALHVIQV